ncbi:hypothetical protein [Catellatospora paridis]|uniref:hypothetical protein n=1 Tax=Catellatospora paridis TaxID=1617086 RepID=UPI0012D3B2F8|nr:hypothetical protein [Catellatospora paridis]
MASGWRGVSAPGRDEEELTGPGVRSGMLVGDATGMGMRLNSAGDGDGDALGAEGEMAVQDSQVAEEGVTESSSGQVLSMIVGSTAAIIANAPPTNATRIGPLTRPRGFAGAVSRGFSGGIVETLVERFCSAIWRLLRIRAMFPPHLAASPLKTKVNAFRLWGVGGCGSTV